MEYLDIKKFLDKNGIDDEKMEHIIIVVSHINWKLKEILKWNKHWSDLNESVLQSAIDIYNKEENVERRQNEI